MSASLASKCFFSLVYVCFGESQAFQLFFPVSIFAINLLNNRNMTFTQSTNSKNTTNEIRFTRKIQLIKLVEIDFVRQLYRVFDFRLQK